MNGQRFALSQEVTMTEGTDPVAAGTPAWIVAEMPPGYQTRLDEIKRLSSELKAMDGIGCILWEKGEVLTDAVGTLFAALKCEVDPKPGDMPAIAVNLGRSRRLLLVVSGVNSPIQKTNKELTLSFQAVQFAGANDRVVLVVNNHTSNPNHRHALRALAPVAGKSAKGTSGAGPSARAGRRTVSSANEARIRNRVDP
jgi:hypothetical protein